MNVIYLLILYGKYGKGLKTGNIDWFAAPYGIFVVKISYYLKC
jgi:hypothetical protein